MACRGAIFPEKLPPTKRAAHFHGLRAHYQIMQWSLLGEEFEFQAQDWGWVSNESMLVPITTDMDIAPPALTNIIRCKCKTSTKNPCSTRLCTCRKYGLPCLSSCGECRGEECTNCEVSPILFPCETLL